MCVGVFFEQANGGLVRASKKHELRELLRVEPVAVPLAPGHWPENSCLCPCDVMATIAIAKKWRVDRVDEYGDVWVKHNVRAKAAVLALSDGLGVSAEHWPTNADEVRRFVGSDYCSLKYGRQDQTPDDSDIYTMSAHDLISAIISWRSLVLGHDA